MVDPPRTTDRMHRHKHRHEPTNKTQGPAVAHRTKATTRPSARQRRILPKSGYERRRFARSIAQSIVQYIPQSVCCCSHCSRTALNAVPPASCNVAAQKQKDSFTVSLSCRRPREPGTSLHPRRNQRPSTISPNLNRLSSKRPFFRRAIR